MAQLSGGKFRYMKRVQKAQYEPHEAEAELSFSIGENEANVDQFMDGVVREVHLRVDEMLGISRPREVAYVERVEHEVVAAQPVTEAVRRTRGPNKTKVTPSAALSELETLAAANKADKDPAAVEEDDAPTKSQEGQQAPIEATSADPAAVGEEDWEAPARVVPDKELSDACAARNQVIKNPDAIRGLVAKYAEPNHGLKHIPGDKREAFLVDLAKLS